MKVNYLADKFKLIKYKITYFEMTKSPNFDWPVSPVPKTKVILFEQTPAWYFTFLYKQVGQNYYWTDWLHKTEKDVEGFIYNQNVNFYTLLKDEWSAGFFVLDFRVKNKCNISYLGLIPEYIGFGLGKYLLQNAILTAWNSNKIKKLTVKSSSLDHKNTIHLFKRYGFEPIKYENFQKSV